MILEVLSVDPGRAAPGTSLRIHVRLDVRVKDKSELKVSIGGVVRPTFQLVDVQAGSSSSTQDGARPQTAPARHRSGRVPLVQSIDQQLQAAARMEEAAASRCEDLSYLAAVQVLAPVLHSRGPWPVQVHAHGASSAAAPQAELRIEPLPRPLPRPQSAAAVLCASSSSSFERPTPAQRAAQRAERERAAAAAAISPWAHKTGQARGLAGRGRTMLESGSSPPLLMPSVKHEVLVQAAEAVSKERQSRTFEVGSPTVTGPEEFHMLVVQLHHTLMQQMGKDAGKPPSTRESEKAFRWADADATGQLTLAELIEAQAVSRELRAQWEEHQRNAAQLAREARLRSHTRSSRRSLDLGVAYRATLDPERTRHGVKNYNEALGKFPRGDHSTPVMSFNPILRPHTRTQVIDRASRGESRELN